MPRKIPNFRKIIILNVVVRYGCRIFPLIFFFLNNFGYSCCAFVVQSYIHLIENEQRLIVISYSENDF